MKDQYGRIIDYLRISVTDRCNLRCIYCMPDGKVNLNKKSDLLTFEEIYNVVKHAHELGVREVRLTGGEPLLRRDLHVLISFLKSIDGLRVSMTTNGTMLSESARLLALNGLDRVNISIDTLKEQKFRYITRVGVLGKALDGVESALEANLNPVKLNVVLIKGFNEDEICDFVEFTLKKPIHVRFIEFMSNSSLFRKYEIPAAAAKQKIEKLYGCLEPIETLIGRGPSKNFKIPGAEGTIGFIAPHRPEFCEGCNRLRISSTGEIYNCLFGSSTANLNKTIAENGSVKSDFIKALKSKPARKREIFDDADIMHKIGG